ncbi:MAG: hypothetical protein ACOX6U_03955 [Oscillospiraceae bacterium]
MAKRGKIIEFHFTASFTESDVSTASCDAVLTYENGCWLGKITRADFGNVQIYDGCLDRMHRSLGKKYSDYCNNLYFNCEKT